MDNKLRELQRTAATGSRREKWAFQDAMCRIGKAIWILRYDENSIGLDNAIVGMFFTREAALDHLQKHEPRAFAGWTANGSAHRDKEDRGRWCVGWRNVVLECSPIHDEAQDKWFCDGDPEI